MRQINFIGKKGKKQLQGRYFAYKTLQISRVYSEEFATICTNDLG